MQELRARIAFVGDRVRREMAGQPAIAYEEFLAARNKAAPWTRAECWLEGYAMAQYRQAMADMLGPNRVRGYVRLAWAAACSPRLTVQRIGRVLRKRRRGSPVAVQPSPPTPLPEGEGSMSLPWPKKYDLFGIQTSATNYEEAAGLVLQAARQDQPAIVSLHAVHAIITACGDPARWALNLLYRAGLRERVYGPELMLRICRRAAAEAAPIYLYGSSPEVIDALTKKLPAKYPGLVIAGAESPPFRSLSPAEEDEMIGRINASGAKILFVGLGYPKQDYFAYKHRDRIRAVQVCVGAAFDFHAGTKKMAPPWMQRNGLEWLFRLCQEPRRLWHRYLVTNTVFATKLGLAMVRRSMKAI